MVTSQVLTSRNGLEGVRVTLQSQVVHRNTLAVACQQNSLVLKYTAAQQTRSHEGRCVLSVCETERTVAVRCHVNHCIRNEIFNQ